MPTCGLCVYLSALGRCQCALSSAYALKRGKDDLFCSKFKVKREAL